MDRVKENMESDETDCVSGRKETREPGEVVVIVFMAGDTAGDWDTSSGDKSKEPESVCRATTHSLSRPLA